MGGGWRKDGMCVSFCDALVLCRNGSLLGRRRGAPCELSGAIINHGIQFFR